MQASLLPAWIRRTAPVKHPPVLAHLLLAGLVFASVGCEGVPSGSLVSTLPELPHAGGRVLDYTSIHNIEIRNLREEHLGRIQDLGIDLENGRLIEVLVEADEGLFTSGRIVAVPPLALLADSDDEIYRLNISRAAFAAAPSINPGDWSAADRNQRVAAAYRYFGQEPYFVEANSIMVGAHVRPKALLGYVERTSKIVDLPVTNLQHQNLGKVWSIRVDFERGRVLSVIVITSDKVDIKHVIPPMALRFNPTRDGLILDDRRGAYTSEPEFVFLASETNPDDHYTQETYAGPHTAAALPQGRSERDIAITTNILKRIQDANIAGGQVTVGTLNERVILRGPVRSEADRIAIVGIAIECSRLELVDDQISVIAAGNF